MEACDTREDKSSMQGVAQSITKRNWTDYPSHTKSQGILPLLHVAGFRDSHAEEVEAQREILDSEMADTAESRCQALLSDLSSNREVRKFSRITNRQRQIFTNVDPEYCP